MKQSGLIGLCILLAAVFVLLQALPVQADEGMRSSSQTMIRHARHSAWIEHTQSTLDELKGKLNLSSEQAAAWETWSRGVTKDAQRQLEQETSWLDDRDVSARLAPDGPTPERMLKGIERLRAETKWMQQQLVQLEAAQARTANFYNTLTVNQKTIFDLFWHLLHHRMAARDDDSGMAMGFCRGAFAGPVGGR